MENCDICNKSLRNRNIIEVPKYCIYCNNKLCHDCIKKWTCIVCDKANCCKDELLDIKVLNDKDEETKVCSLECMKEGMEKSSTEVLYDKEEVKKVCKEHKELTLEVNKLKKKIKELETEVLYQPNGKGYYEAKNNFEKLKKI